MELFSQGDKYTLYKGSMLDMLDNIEPNSIDSIITDPPYELNFMGKGWDNSGIAFQADTWKKCYDVLKSGGYLLAFGGSRTFHRIAVAIEDAGFEIRDTIMWMYGSGFPKSMNLGKSVESKLVNGSANPTEFKNLNGTKVESGNWGISKMANEQGARPSDYSADGHMRTETVDYTTEQGKQWDGWGTCLKPAYEPIIIARKPCEGSVTDNVLEYGVGGINIDECRIGNETHKVNINDFSNQHGNKWGNREPIGKLGEKEITGRFPANVMLTYDDTDFEEVCGGFPNTKSNGGNPTMSDFSKYNGSMMNTSNLKADSARKESDYIAPADSGSASRYFYCAKASRIDRDEGLLDEKNMHPTVKPTELMQYIIKLVTPKNGIILDPFNGSGSTGKATMLLNRINDKHYKYIGIDLSDEYLQISDARINWASKINLSIYTNTKTTKKPKEQTSTKLF